MPPRKPEGPPPPPVVQRLWVQYARRGRLRFSSHRDFHRALERALRRANVPMAYSAGFNPHPKISFANAAPTGMASEAEYLELALAASVEPDALASALDAALPPGLDIVAVRTAPDRELGNGALVDRLEASVWQIRLNGVEPDVAAAAVETFMVATEVPVERLTKNGIRKFDARSAVASALIEAGDAPGSDSRQDRSSQPCAILTAVVRHTTPAVRPDDVLTGLRLVADLAPPAPPLVTRLAQGPLAESGGAVADPLDPNRDVVDLRMGAGARS